MKKEPFPGKKGTVPFVQMNSGEMLLQRGGQLIRAGSAAEAALNALEALDGLFDGHALDERSDALRVAHAAADKAALGHHAVSISYSIERLHTPRVL